ncbi:hypothetical protein MHL31_03400 [Lutibacter sp. A80]|uniref:hypothetical protein n=1 Tax=Lutibacter sp. A80 TaxID=2918453 RepID=UPI001F070AAD|nr:hypothetical protein [Lutibacter sp. A80]UMB61255.1 hypothetical protein MHL31_03400 [Lutibacter sp. A80]
MKNKIHFYLYLTIVSFVLYSCSALDENDNLTYSNNFDELSFASPVLLRINSEVFNTLTTSRLSNIETSDLFEINKANRIDDIIEVSISYSGGCKQHSFEVIWDGIVYTDPPCFMNLLIIHNANNDNCEALITETISINLKDLIGENNYKDNCTYNIFIGNNSTNTADIIIESSN